MLPKANKPVKYILPVSLFALVAVISVVVQNLSTDTAGVPTSQMTINDEPSYDQVEPLSEEAAHNEAWVAETMEINESTPDADPQVAKSEEIRTVTFARAFTEARAQLGPGQTFVWNGQEYTTDYREELISPTLALSDNFPSDTMTGTQTGDFADELHSDSSRDFPSPELAVDK